MLPTRTETEKKQANSATRGDVFQRVSKPCRFPLFVGESRGDKATPKPEHAKLGSAAGGSVVAWSL